MLTQYISWCDKVYAAIDCYSWVFSNAYLAPNEVFSCEYIYTGCQLCYVELWVCILVKSSSDNVPSKMLDVIGYFVRQLAMLDIGSLAAESGHYSKPYNAPFLPHEEELYNKLVHHFASSSSTSSSI